MANPLNAHKAESERFPIPCTHTEKGANSSCDICLRVEVLNGNVVEARHAFDDAVEQLSVYLDEEVNHRYDPIRRLPVELALSIFFLCFPYLASSNIFDASRAARMDYALRPIPLLLGSICRYWRRVVWASPRFWNIIWLHVTPYTTMTRSQILAEWLPRSDQLPLYVCMFWVGTDETIEHRYHLDDDRLATAWNSINHMIDSLTRYTHRIKVFHLHLDISHISRFWYSSRNPPAYLAATNSIMERLFIEQYHLASCDSQHRHAVPFKLIQNPSPTHVSFINIDFRQLRLRWDNVTVVDAQLLAQGALEILQLAPKLQHFKVNIKRSEDGSMPPYRVTHYSLLALEITGENDLTFLDHLVCPTLEKCSYNQLFDFEAAASFQSLFSRSGCPLKDLAVNGLCRNLDHLMSVLRVIPSLTHLSFVNCGFLDCLLACFIDTLYSQDDFGNDPTEELFLPRLHSLSFSTYLDGWRKADIFPIISKSRRAVAIISQGKVPWRPLTRIHVEVVLFADVANIWSSGGDIGGYVIDCESLVEVMDLGRHGVEIEIIDHEGFDLILLSQHFHELF